MVCTNDECFECTEDGGCMQEEAHLYWNDYFKKQKVPEDSYIVMPSDYCQFVVR